jgi:hypothetical protein
MTTAYPISLSSTVKLNSSGNGTCPGLGPIAPGETWNVTLISVQCSTNVVESVAQVFFNGALIGTTLTGSTGDADSAITQPMSTGQTMTATWTGGDPGATATMTVIGIRTV